MFGRILGHISRRTVHLVVGLLLTALIAFFAATRTQVGRDELRDQLVASFNATYEGELTIGRLTGNLLYTLYAEDVYLSGPDGSAIAHIDSVVLEPRWSELIHRTFSVRTISLHRAEVNLTTDSSGVLNFTRALAHRTPDSTGTRPRWVFKSATLALRDGSLALTNGATDRNASVGLDLSNNRLHSIDLDARVDWSAPDGQIDLLGFSAVLDRPRLAIRGGQSQILIQGTRLTSSALDLDIGRSSLTISGFVNLFGDQATRPLWNRPFMLDLEPGRVDFDQLTELFPELGLSGSATVSALVQGPASDATISWLRLQGVHSRAELSGQIIGLPDSVRFDLTMTASHLDPLELRTWMPGVPALTHLRMDSLATSIASQGVFRKEDSTSYLEARGRVELTSERGSVASDYEFEGPIGNELAYSMSGSSSGLDLSRWTRRRNVPTSLTGAYRLVGAGIQPDSAFAEFRMDLSNVRYGDARAPSFSLTGKTDHGRYEASVSLNQRGGEALADINGRFEGGMVDYAVFLDASGLDVGRLLGADSLRTNLNFMARLEGSGADNQSVAGELQLDMDSSDVFLGRRSSRIVPQTHRLAVRRPGAVGPRVSLRGDLADVDVTGEVRVPQLRRLGTAWIRELSAALRRQQAKPLYEDASAMEPGAELDLSLAWAEAETALGRIGRVEPYKFSIQIAVHDLGLASAYWPTLPQLASAGEGSASFTIDSERLIVESNYSADTLRIGSTRMYAAAVKAEFDTARRPAVEEALHLEFELQSDTARVLGQTLIDAHASFRMLNRQGVFDFRSPGWGRLDSVVVRAALSLRPDRNEVDIQRLSIEGGVAHWEVPDRPSLRLYSDAVEIPSFRLLQIGPDGPTGKRLVAHGRFSDVARDTLYVQADDFELHDVSRFIRLNPHLDGVLNATILATGGGNRPSVAGEANVQHFTLDHRVLGDVVLESRFIPGSPDLDVSLSLLRADSTRIVRPMSGDPIPTWIDNRLDLAGTLRLPGQSADGTDRPGSVDLDFDVERADLFFLKYIFGDLDHIRGYADGGGRITGLLSRPVFDIRLDLHDGAFELQQFNLACSLSGAVHFDREAIRIDRLSLVDQTGGTLEGTGSLLFNEYRFFTLDLGMNLDRFQIMNVAYSEDLPFYGFLWGSGRMTLEGPLSGSILRSTDAEVTENSELFIPVQETAGGTDDAYIVFADSAGHIPDFGQLSRRSFLLGRRPRTERRFLDALDMDLGIFAPTGSTIHLVIDPLLGDVINASSTGHVQIDREEGDFSIYGELEVNGGDYLFTAGEVFVRRFIIEEGGTITWEGDPVNATLNIPAVYRTRASLAGLPGYENTTVGLIPLIVSLQIGGTVQSPTVELGLSIDRTQQNVLGDYQALEAQLNSPERATEYATSVLLTNTFRLTTDSFDSGSGGQLAFNSVSQLVSSQVNRFINQALPNVDFNFGLQGENAQDLDVTYGVALRLLDERLIIRGEGVYQGSRADNVSTTNEGLQGEFQVEVRLSPTVSVQVFFRREGDILESADLTNTTGAGLSYRTEFSSWNQFLRRLFGWMTSDREEDVATPPDESAGRDSQ